MKHNFESFIAPYSTIVVWRCKFCALKTANKDSYEDQDCLQSPASKMMNTQHAEGFTFNHNQRLYFKSKNNGRHEKLSKKRLEPENIL